MERSIADAVAIRPGQMLITLSHTHAAGLMSRSRADLPGGELIGPYLDSVATQLGRLAAKPSSTASLRRLSMDRAAASWRRIAIISMPRRNRFVCGLNPRRPG